ncbi:trifunctional serine/threonine-protein kinase/ATP-binding protein/sensor histidine kinase [Hyalangium gracile]|uniref:trifunctional serine/threonine-protein kinase/ATP-binding protein/sensor histidine kinase n=1 Tax=Hyalangium gracile TaxID=394092 RepID=UPI001CCEE1B1|nr:trifunctional serine/threonine-protein kinase/ATP-binding protein/sensor histidine kinase [Hyalangium gracile]
MLELPGYTQLEPLPVRGTTLLYRALRGDDRRPVILKMPRSEHLSARERARFEHEYTLLRRLEGTPGVLTALAFEVHQNRPVLVLERVEGTPLSEQKQEPLEPGRFLPIASALAATLAEVHRRGVIHKDLQPAHILLAPTGQPWIIDFGSATLQQVQHVQAAPPQLMEGTPAYMSPEQSGRMNRTLDYRTDLYSLGITFYQLLTGSLPFEGKDALEWIHAHLAQAPVPPHQRVASIPPMLSAVVLKLIAKMPEERYQSFEGLKADLEACRERLSRADVEEFSLGSQDFPARFQLPQRLYGRDNEVEALLNAFERVTRQGRSEWILVRGYSGIGKSSVVHALHQPVLQRRGFFLSGKFDQLQRDVPYATLAQAFKGLVQQLLASSDTEIESWRQRLLEAFEGFGQVLVDLVPQLEWVVGRQPPLSEMPPQEAQNRFHRVFQRFLSVFATPERPLVLFLDDLQWADFASLELLKFLATHPDTPPLLWVGAYRDNEVSSSHPLMLTVDEVRKAGTRLGDISLGPLLLEQTRQLVGDALPGTRSEVVQALTAVLQAKTGGNPFFLLQLLQTLYQDGLLVRAPGGGWRWDEAGVKAKGYSDNVVEFMAGRLRQLPEPTQQLLRLAACVGNAFSAPTLALLGSLESLELERRLEPALHEEMVVQTGGDQYRFLHDRIQQAAYALIPEVERKAVHLRIGRMLLASLSQEQLRERLFDVVGQLNAGAELMGDADERLRLARLNAEAGWRAKASAAWRSAVGYFNAVFPLLPGDPWKTEHALAFKLRLDQASCELMAGHPAAARQLVDELLPRANGRPELAEAYRLKSTLHLAAGEIEAAVVCLLECLERFGMPMPHSPTPEEIRAVDAEVWALLGDRPIESLAELPPMVDPDMKAALSIMADLTVPALYSGSSLLPFHLCRMVALSIRHGNAEVAAHGYAWFGLVGCVASAEKYQEGYAFGRVAQRLVDRPEFAAHRSGTLFILAHLSRWVRSFSVSLGLFHETFRHALPRGDFRNACYCCDNIIINRLLMGHELSDVYQESVARLEFVRKANYEDVGTFLTIFQRHVQQLRGHSAAPGSLDGDGFNEQEFEARVASRGLHFMACIYFITKMKARYFGGQFEEARQAADAADKLLGTISGLIIRFDFHLFRALTLAACYREASPEQRQASLSAARQHHQQLVVWAGLCPENFRAAERMVAGELARMTGKTEDAMRAYEEAMQSGRENGLVHHAAMAAELAARFSQELGWVTASNSYAREAWDFYRQWGAEGKARLLEVQWPRVAISREGSQGTTGASQLDALSVVKAQQAVSREIVLDRLVATLMSVALQSAGAQRGALLLRQGDLLKVVALSDATGSKPREGNQALPWTLLSYVRRTGEPVVIDDTSRPHAYLSDGELLRSHARSVLCLPLRRKEEFYGVLYLENSLTTQAFTPGRLALLGHIASQAAISIENARLYTEVQRAEAALRQANEELEQRVEERTRELTQAQAQLVDTARMVGMAEVATNVLHDVGNVLTSIVVDTGLMRQTVASSRLGRMKQLAALLEEQRDNLVGFLTKDPRGSHLVDYLSGLALELSHEQEALLRTLEDLNKNVNRVRAIVQMQQTYATSTLLTEECELGELLEDALRLQQGVMRHAGVQVTREVSPLPRVKVDRYKVLQILLNLISNACHAMENVPMDDRRLVVRLEPRGEWARIQVVDNGAGIAPESRARLFTQGFTTRKQGHGIGLHSSALAARLLGARLTLESEGLSKGATATLELPFEQPMAATVAEA